MKRYVAALLTASFAAAWFPRAGFAQQSNPFEEVAILVRPGDVLAVIDTAGNSTQGKFEGFLGASLRLRTGSGVREFTQANVAEIRRQVKDSVRDGAKKGLYVGIALGLVAGLTSSRRGVHNGEAPLAGVVTGAVYGAAIGAIVDGRKKTQQTIYRSDGVSGPRRLRVSPVVSRDHKAVSLTVSF